MHHTSDEFLLRTITNIDEVGNNEVLDIVICQSCHLSEIKSISNYIFEKSERRGWENAIYMSEDKYGEILTKDALNYLEANTESSDKITGVKLFNKNVDMSSFNIVFNIDSECLKKENDDLLDEYNKVANKIFYDYGPEGSFKIKEIIERLIMDDYNNAMGDYNNAIK